MFGRKKYLKRIQELEYKNASLSRVIRDNEEAIKLIVSHRENLTEKYKKATDKIQELETKLEKWKPLADLISSIPINEGDPISIPDRGVKMFLEYQKSKE